MKQSQLDWVKEQLVENGFITRNQCLRQHISRLGALILMLKHEGYEFYAEFQKTENGKDYVYTVITFPERKQKELFKTHIISV